MTLAPYLRLDRLTKRYGATLALDAVDAEIARGEFVALLGPSGCGKTTLLRLVAGFLTPDAGSIRLDGRAIEGEPPQRRNIGVVFQNYALFPHMTVTGNVGFGLRMRHVPREQRRDRVQAILAVAGLGALADRYPAQLSGGQQQRVALARALVIEPDLLLLDEPLSNLDAGLRADLRDEIRALQQRLGITAIFVSHDQAEALAISDRVFVMRGGRVVEAATPVELSELPRTRFTAEFLGARTVVPGRAADGRFDADGLALALPADAPRDPSHIVLRAARLDVSPGPAARPGDLFRAPGRVEAVTYLGDVEDSRIALGGTRLRVQRPTLLPPLAVGQSVWVGGDEAAISWLSDRENQA